MKKVFVVMISLLLIFLLSFSSCVYYFFYDISHIRGQELIYESVSQNKTYTVKAYRNNGGATTDYSVLCKLHFNNKLKRDKNIYWEYHCWEAVIEWIDDDTLIINGKRIEDVTKDTYDFRSDSDLHKR